MAKSIEAIAKEILLENELSLEDIPDLDLYIDQITTLFDRTYESHKRYHDEKIITKAMVNNYCKKGVVESIPGKKYSKDRILEILFVYNLKNILMIDEIQRLLAPIYHLKKNDEFDIYEFYENYSQNKLQRREISSEAIQKIILENDLSLNSDEERLKTILTLANFADAFQQAAQKIIDIYYPVNKDKH